MGSGNGRKLARNFPLLSRFWTADEDAGRRQDHQYADWTAEHPSADYLPYCVSKAGVIALTSALARALAPTVQVNSISPGAILMPEHFSEEESDRPADPALQKRLCNTDDIVAALLFLASGSDNITGTNIVI
jgi:NAD(P)-dependent dehydrogenase (short-subunit alcohol dehydrogenase family)